MANGGTLFRSRSFDRPTTGRIAVKVMNHYVDEVVRKKQIVKVFNQFRYERRANWGGVGAWKSTLPLSYLAEIKLGQSDLNS